MLQKGIKNLKDKNLVFQKQKNWKYDEKPKTQRSQEYGEHSYNEWHDQIVQTKESNTERIEDTESQEEWKLFFAFQRKLVNTN